MRKVARIQKCSECERFRSEIKDYIDRVMNSADIKLQKNSHNAFFGRESRNYGKKTELAKVVVHIRPPIRALIATFIILDF